MNETTLDLAIQTAKEAAESAKDYKSETYAAVLLFELMRSAVATKNRYELAQAPSSHSPRREKPYSSAELFATKSWNTEIEKVVLAGYFLERFGRSVSYTIEEVRNCLLSAKVAQPKNLSLAILQAVQKGLMMEIPSQGGPRKAWALTQRGERYVENMTLKYQDSRM
jgi:hypothetical protein